MISWLLALLASSQVPYELLVIANKGGFFKKCFLARIFKNMAA